MIESNKPSKNTSLDVGGPLDGWGLTEADCIRHFRELNPPPPAPSRLIVPSQYRK